MHSSEMLDSIINSFSVIFMGKNFLRLLQGLLVTIEIAAVSVVFSIILGFLLGALMTVKIKPLQIICKIYLEFMRIMPQLVLLFWRTSDLQEHSEFQSAERRRLFSCSHFGGLPKWETL